MPQQHKEFEAPRLQTDSNPFLHSARQALSQTELLDTVARFSPTPTWIIHQEKIAFVNAAAVALLSAPDPRRLVGRNPEDFLQGRELTLWTGASIIVAVERHAFESSAGPAQFVSFQPLSATRDPDLYAQLGVPACFTDTKHKLVRWNRHFSALRASYPELAVQLEPLFEQVLQSGEGLNGIEIQTQNCDWLVALEPVRGVDRVILGVNTSFQDISVLKKAEREQRLVYQAIGDSLDFGIWICDAEGRNTYTSEGFCKLIGLTQEQCSGFGWTQAMNPDRAALVVAAWQECVALGRNWTAEPWFKTGEERWQPVLMRGVPVRDGAGKILCWAGIILDIRSFKAAQEELEEANQQLARTNQELEEFAHTAGHDLQEPLRVIRMMTSLVMKRYEGVLDEAARTCLATTEESAARMSNLVQDLLEYARILQPPVITGQVADLNQAVEIAILSCQASIEESGATVDADPLPMSSAGLGAMARVFQNLISNAIKYRREEPPQIRITADQRGQEWRFCVADNGLGIDYERHATIFMPFKRLHSQDVPGSGLGLAVCKKIVEQHGGRIWVESQPGVGSLFFFTLPVD